MVVLGRDLCNASRLAHPGCAWMDQWTPGIMGRPVRRRWLTGLVAELPDWCLEQGRSAFMISEDVIYDDKQL